MRIVNVPGIAAPRPARPPGGAGGGARRERGRQQQEEMAEPDTEERRGGPRQQGDRGEVDEAVGDAGGEHLAAAGAVG